MDTKELKYVVGLDIGITSVGWATLLLDSQDEPIRILDLNSRIFDKAESEDGASLAAPRRMARGTRRRLRRRKFRLHLVRQYILRYHILDKNGLEGLYKPDQTIDIFALRTAGLERQLEPEEWARILLYMAKHRGFKSNRKSTADATADGDMLEAIQQNKEVLSKYRSVGEMFDKDEKFSAHKRNKGGSYEFTVARSMLVDEIKLLFEKQRDFGSAFATEAAEEKYIELFSRQRNFDDGPGKNSPYYGVQIEKMIGECTFEEGEKRAPKASYAFMATNLWQKINQIRIIEDDIERPLTSEEARKVAGIAWKEENMTYKDIRSEIGLGDEASFKGIGNTKDKMKTEKKSSFSWVKGFHKMRAALDNIEENRIFQLSHEDIDKIAYVFSVYKSDQKRQENLNDWIKKNTDSKISQVDIKALIEHIDSFSGFGHLSLKACYKILPKLEAGYEYSKACQLAGCHLKEINKADILKIPNPVVRRAVGQALKVLRAIEEKYGCPPVEIHVEMARELARSFDERQKMTKSMEDNKSRNERIKERLKTEFHVPYPSGQDIVKLKLYEEQNGKCAYSQKYMDVERLFHGSNYAEVDHIIPYSRSFDDTYNNKVLVLTAENRQKGNRTPMEYLANDEARKKQFVAWVKSDIKKPRKRENLLRENFSEGTENDWKERNLQDTQYISRFVLKYLQKYYPIQDSSGKTKQRVFAVNGIVTSYIRKRFKIEKIRANGDLHHAVDAVIVAAVTPGIIKKISQYSKRHELRSFFTDKGFYVDPKTGEIIQNNNSDTNQIPQLWPLFKEELEARVSENPTERIRELKLSTYNLVEEIKTPFVSRMVRRKKTGQAHKETVKGVGITRDKGKCKTVIVKKVSLDKLELTQDGEKIKNYYNKESDWLLYKALLKRLQKFKERHKKNSRKTYGQEAFEDIVFHKPKADGSEGPVVNKVKVIEDNTLSVSVYRGNGVADNATRVRTDVFKVPQKNGKYKYNFVPIYVPDTIKDVLPNKAITGFKEYDEWTQMNDKDFVFSLYPNDVIYIGGREFEVNSLNNAPQRKLKDAYVYYKGINIRNGNIHIETHDKAYEQPSLGVKTVPILEKYEVTVLGDLIKAPYRSRETFGNKDAGIHNV